MSIIRIQVKTIGLMVYDVIAILVISGLSLLLRFDLSFRSVDVYFWNNLMKYAVINLIVTILIFWAFHLYANLWEYAGTNEMLSVVLAVLIADGAQLVGTYLTGWKMPRSYYVAYFLLLLVSTVTSRFWQRLWKEMSSLHVSKKNAGNNPTLLYGAGEAGQIILREIQTSQYVKRTVPCVLDDDPRKKGTFLMGVPVVGGREQLVHCIEKYHIQEIIIAIPSLVDEGRKELVEACAETGCRVQILPGMFQLINRDINITALREVELEDLLGRAPIRTDLDIVMGYVSGKVVLVTGGGGSIGSELCRQVAQYQPKQLIILDNYENNAYDLQMELIKKFPQLDLVVVIASVQNRDRIHEIFGQYCPELVYHAAAHKHVPLMEGSPCEAIKNNVNGTYNVVREADISGVKRFVMISTDKAVRPTNIMGASKRICEMIVQSYNQHSNTEYVAVRFGNVLGSNGSVVPLFKRQIAQGGPVTVTHPDIIRYFMTIPEAVSLVLQAGAYAHGGEIFILDMGDPVKILDMAKNLIRLSGYVPGVDIDIVFTGLRPGEKLYEELLMEEEKTETQNKRIFVGKTRSIDMLQMKGKLEALIEAAYHEEGNIRQLVQELVPEYTIKEP